MTGVSTIQSAIARPGHSTGDFDGVVQVSAVNYSAKSGEWTPWADRMVGRAYVSKGAYNVTLTVIFSLSVSGNFRVWLKGFWSDNYSGGGGLTYLSCNGVPSDIYLPEDTVQWIDCGVHDFVAGGNTVMFGGSIVNILKPEVFFTLYDFYITKNGDTPNY